MVAEASHKTKREPRKAAPVFSEAESRLWSEYQSSPSIAARNALVEFYGSLLGRVAWKLRQRLAGCELEDLISDGVPALIWAVERFDPSLGIKFSTYAGRRLCGGVLDAIRKRDQVPRLARKHAKRLMEVQAKWAYEHGREPTNAELSHALRLSASELAAWKRDANLCNIGVVSLDQMTLRAASWGGTVDAWMLDPFVAIFADKTTPSPDARIDGRERWDAILRGLGKRSRVAVVLYYAHRWTMKTIAKHLMLSEGRVSQMLSESRIRLRKYASKADFDDIPTGGAGRLIDILPMCRRLRQSRFRRRRWVRVA